MQQQSALKCVYLVDSRSVTARDRLYLGVSLLLTDETVSRQAKFGYTSVPDVFDQCADLIGFRNVVRGTVEIAQMTT